ncbi:MAG: type II toxin-antitoxin system VapB family antitoxin [Gammaproteobacteria bacterium]|nr:type II toxin-antitoxin system VapB family antitoxin [Gammaproteobacteria bacterium]
MLHRTNVVLDEEIMQEAMTIGHIKTKRALIDTAIREFIAKRKKPNIMDLKGVGGIREDYDYKTLRSRDLPEHK